MRPPPSLTSAIPPSFRAPIAGCPSLAFGAKGGDSATASRSGFSVAGRPILDVLCQGWDSTTASGSGFPLASPPLPGRWPDRGSNHAQQFLPSLRDLVPLFAAYPGLTLRLRSGQAGAIVCRRSAAGAVLASICVLRLRTLFNTKFKNNGNFKGNGRGRPLHTLSVGGRVEGSESRFLALLGMTS